MPLRVNRLSAAFLVSPVKVVIRPSVVTRPTFNSPAFSARTVEAAVSSLVRSSSSKASVNCVAKVVPTPATPMLNAVDKLTSPRELAKSTPRLDIPSRNFVDRSSSLNGVAKSTPAKASAMLDPDNGAKKSSVSSLPAISRATRALRFIPRSSYALPNEASKFSM